MAIADIAINIITKGAELAKRQMQGLGNSATSSSKNLGQLSTMMKAGVALSAVALAKGIASAVQEFTAFDEQLNQSLAIMKTTEEQQEAMIRATQQVAMETRIGTKESAEAYFFLASAGLDAEQSISALPQVAKFAQAGMFDMATATDLATDAQSALGLTVSDAGQNLTNLTRVTDVLVKANTLANASVQQFSEALTNKAGAALKVVNKDVEEGVAVLAVFADRGVKGAEAGEKLNQVLRDIPRATAKNKDEFEKLGLQLFDANGKMKNVADVVEELDRVLGPMSDELKASTLDQLGLNRGVADAVKILSGSTDQIRQYEDALRNAGGATQEVADNQMKSIQAELDVLHNKWEILLQDIGKDFEGATRGTIGLLDKLITKIIELRQVSDEEADALQKYTLEWRDVQKTIGYTTFATKELVRVLHDTEKSHDDERDAIELYNASLMDLRQTKEETIVVTEEEIEAEQELAKEREDKALGALEKVMSAYKKYQRIFENIADLQKDEKDALKKLNTQKEKEQLANDEVQKALDELNKQKEISKQVTLEEQLAIERQREAIARLEEQEERSKVQNLELQLAKQRLTELIAESTSATSEETSAQRQYENALKEVERQQEATKKAQEDYRQAQEDLAKATERNTENLLEMAVAKKALDDAIADAEAIGALESGLKQMVDSVGGDLDRLRAKFQSIFDLSGKPVPSFAPSGGGGAGGGSETYDNLGTLTNDAPVTSSASDRFAYTQGQRGGVTTINNIQVAVEGALSDKQDIQDAVAIAVIEAQKRGTKVIL
jgi:TP901 family phage tail tape measure protein